MITKNEVVRSVRELELFTLSQSSPNQLKMELKFLSADQNTFYEKSIKDISNICGCKTGKYFAGIAFLLCLTGIFAKIKLFQTSVFMTIAITFFLTFIAASFGKLFGLFSAKWKLRQIIRELRHFEEKDEGVGIAEEISL